MVPYSMTCIPVRADSMTWYQILWLAYQWGDTPCPPHSPLWSASSSLGWWFRNVFGLPIFSCYPNCGVCQLYKQCFRSSRSTWFSIVGSLFGFVAQHFSWIWLLMLPFYRVFLMFFNLFILELWQFSELSSTFYVDWRSSYFFDELFTTLGFY